eukprot:9184308-Alexandrium_andersonii.AAC.1
MLRLLGAQQRGWVVLGAEGPFARERTFLSTLLPGPSAERRRRRDRGGLAQEVCRQDAYRHDGLQWGGRAAALLCLP